MRRIFLILVCINCLTACTNTPQKNDKAEVSDKKDDTTAVVVAGRPRAKSLYRIEETISAYLKRITYWRDQGYEDTTISPADSIAAVNDSLEKYLSKVCHDEPATLASSLDSSGLGILTSADGNLRLYCWDTWTGGTMHYYENYAQFLDGNKLHFVSMKDTAVDGDFGCDYSDLTEIHTNAHKTVYIVTGHLPVSSKDVYVTIDAWIIEDGALKHYPLFETKTKELAHIDYGYDMFRWASDKDIPDVHFNKDKTRLYIPIVDGEAITDTYLVYQFDGEKFVFDKNAR